MDQSRTAYHHTNGPAEKNQTDLARPKRMERDARASRSRRRFGEHAHIVWPRLMTIPLAIGVLLDGFGCDPVGGMQVDVISDPAAQDQRQNHRPGSCVRPGEICPHSCLGSFPRLVGEGGQRLLLCTLDVALNSLSRELGCKRLLRFLQLEAAALQGLSQGFPAFLHRLVEEWLHLRIKIPGEFATSRLEPRNKRVGLPCDASRHFVGRAPRSSIDDLRDFGHLGG